jgi:ATP-binding cassette subfamily B protein
MQRHKNKQARFNRWLGQYVLQHLPSILILSSISLIAVLFELLEPWPIKILVDSGFGNVSPPLGLSRLDKPDLLIIISLSFMSKLYDKIQNLPLRYLRDKQTGDYAYRLNSEAGDVSQLIFSISNNILASSLLVIGILIVMAKIDLVLALIALIVAPLLYVSILKFTPTVEKQSRKVEESNSELYSYTTESIDNVQLIQSYNIQKRQLTLIERLLKRNFIYQMKSLITNEKYSLVNDGIATIAMAVLVVLGADRVYAKDLTVGDLLIFLTYLSYLYSPLQTISDSISDARSYFAASKRVFEIYAYDKPVRQIDSPLLLNHIKGKIELSHVSYSYDKRQILNDLNITIEPGEKVGIVGRSGEGKTTLLNLFPRFYDPDSGIISIDDTPIGNFALSNLRDQFAIVSQDTRLFNTSILNNLKLARSGRAPSFDEIIQATKDANAYDFIMKLPQGIRTRVGEHGKLLSGGQRQRIAIARAFLKNSPILLLDEPSTGLDEESVSIILIALERLIANRTTLIVSHTLEVLKNTDTVYLLDNGKIISKTTYANLMNEYSKSLSTSSKELSVFRDSLFDRNSDHETI